MFWYDHSSYDASQTARLRYAVSAPFAIRYLRETFAKYEQPSAYMNPLVDYLTRFVVSAFYSAPVQRRTKTLAARKTFISG